MKRIKQAGLYARVSTNQQDCENQLIELRKYCVARDWNAVEFTDSALSGSLDEDKRPALKSILKAARSKEIQAVIVWDFSRFARSMRQLVEALDLFRSLNIAFISLREGIDTTTSNGRLMFGIFASLAEFERELIRERVMLGLNKARKAGKVLGRPKVSLDVETLLKLKADGLGVRAIAAKVGVSKDTVRNVWARLAKKPSLPENDNRAEKSNTELVAI